MAFSWKNQSVQPLSTAGIVGDIDKASRALARLYCIERYNGREKEQAPMAGARSSQKPKKARTLTTLMVRLDHESKTYLSQAAQLRRISVSEYVRAVTIAQARREVLAAGEQTIALTADEQMAFWNALNETPKLTDDQRL